ncbi:BMP family ABC transporter substrate-binding protein [Enterocloster citroniae]|uniref:BMP family lipoprotein n=1 Tax=Enterocloster citroniae TaxID=358743 RepID=UPI0032BFAE05
MKKRLLSVVLAAAMAASLAGCVQKPGASGNTDSNSAGTAAESGAEAGSSQEGYELALITDVGSIDDKSFNQGSWEGLEAYAKDNNLTCKYYKPNEKSDEACINSINLAVKGGAKVIVTPGFLFEVPIYESQTKYPDIKFIIIDAEPKSGDDVKIESNVLSIFYAEEQAGYLAGYAAVTEGYTQLGFMGGIAVPAVIRYGYGFIQGADAAAKEMGLEPGSVSVKYTYVGNFDASPENNAKAAAWYNEGTECIFACGGGVGNSVMKAAESAGKVVIGVDVDQSSESATVITSAMKNLGDSVYDAVAGYYDGNFEGGKSVTLDAKENGIMLPMETSKFKVFTQEKYDELYEMLKDGTIQVANDTVATQASAVPTDIVKVDLIK